MPSVQDRVEPHLTAVRCTIRPSVDCRVWVFTDPDGHEVFEVSAQGEPIERRAKPPFYQLIPCPYCGVKEDRNHLPLKHVDPRLGTPITEEEEMFARTLARTKRGGCDGTS